MSPRKPVDQSGLSRGHEEDGDPAGNGPQARPAWMSQQLIEETRRVWSGVYRRIVPESEAVEILASVRRFAEAVLEARKEEP